MSNRNEVSSFPSFPPPTDPVRPPPLTGFFFSGAFFLKQPAVLTTRGMAHFVAGKSAALEAHAAAAVRKVFIPGDEVVLAAVAVDAPFRHSALHLDHRQGGVILDLQGE